MNTDKLKEELLNVTDPRRQYGNLRHKLEDIVIIGLLSTMSLGEDFEDMEMFGKEREEWLRTFLELPNGIPDSDTFRRIFERLDPKELSCSLSNILEIKRERKSTINIDGKTIRGSSNGEHKAYHIVSAWVAENKITLGEIKVDEKSNEIKAVPVLLDMLEVEGSTITADAMSCQKVIAEKITDKKADYVIGLKGNQESLLSDVELYFAGFSEKSAKSRTIEKGHGRIENREYFLETEIDWLSQREEWSNLRGIGMVISTVEEKGKIYREKRYFITSLRDIGDFSYSVRKHWSIENQLHWCLDVVFREDSARARKDNSPLNMNVLRKTALSMLSNVDFGRMGLRKKMRKTALNLAILEKVIFGGK